MIKLCVSISILFIFASCKGQVLQHPENSGKASDKASPLVPDMSPPVEDPYFQITKDTISTHGPQSITRNLLQDRQGNYWFATWQGILRYDDTLFTNYTLKENLRKFHVFSVLEDSKGNLWFGTIRGGVYRYDGKSFTLFTTQNGLANDMVMCFLEDAHGDIWIGTDEGVSRYDGKSFINYNIQDGLAGPSVNSMTQDHTGKIWFASRDGDQTDVSYYDGRSFTAFTNKAGKPFSNVRTIIEDKKGNIWIGGQSGLWRYHQETGELISIVDNFIGYLFEDTSGNIWVSHGVDNGMAFSRLVEKKLINLMIKDIPGDQQVFGITEDHQEHIWFGTMNGAVRYDPKSDGKTFFTY